jgi:hypothetical protein
MVLIAAVTLGLAALRQSRVVAHEWGTFTTIAGPGGRSVDWIPLGGPVDLPCFVNVITGAEAIVPAAAQLVPDPLRLLASAAVSDASLIAAVLPKPDPVAADPVNPLERLLGKVAGLQIRGGVPSGWGYEQARASFRGSVRMETPVIYFYSPRQEKIDVRVDFPKGLITEWYPPARVEQTPIADSIGAISRSSIRWSGVSVLPGSLPTLPVEKNYSHYYAARATDAVPVFAGSRYEKFLFYRGLGAFQVPLLATEEDDGSILVTNTGKEIVPAVLLFENRDGRVGYRMAGAVSGGTRISPVVLEGNGMPALERELVKLLVATGLYEKEAQAMVDTWRDSWFEEGSRIIYIVPSETVDEILPLSITPAPMEVKRAFVGRMEIITKETIRRVSVAIDREDEAVLIRYGRFLGPIADRLRESAPVAQRNATRKYLDDMYRDYVKRSEPKCQ